jgi:hypothetical protein
MSILQRIWVVALGVAIVTMGCLVGFYSIHSLDDPFDFVGMAIACVGLYFGIATLCAVLPGRLRL